MKQFGPGEVANLIATGFQTFFMRKEAIKRFGDTRDDFIGSFIAAAVTLPIFLWIGWFGLAPQDDLVFQDVAPFYRLFTHVITHAINWVYWPLIMFYVYDFLNKSDQWMRLTVVSNWTAVTPFLGFGILAILSSGGGGETLAGMAFGLQVWVFVVHAWLLRTILETPMPLTVGLVVGNFILGLVVFQTQTIVMLAG